MIVYLAYTNFIQDSFSVEEERVKTIERNFLKEVSEYRRTLRMSGVSGMDVTFDVEDVLRRVEKLRRDLRKLMLALKEEPAREKAKDLEKRINTFLSDSRYR